VRRLHDFELVARIFVSPERADQRRNRVARRSGLGQRRAIGLGGFHAFEVEGHRLEAGRHRGHLEGRQRHGVGHPHAGRLELDRAGRPVEGKADHG
jgi:hypothetical protein